MKTLDEIWDLVESLNNEAHNDAWDSWVQADEAETSDDEDADPEYLRELASDEQAEYFRNSVADLDPEDRAAIQHWIANDDTFSEQFRCYYGYDEFDAEYGTAE